MRDLACLPSASLLPSRRARAHTYLPQSVGSWAGGGRPIRRCSGVGGSLTSGLVRVLAMLMPVKTEPLG